MEESKEEKIYYINVDDILPNRFQPRLAFDEKELNELSSSILKYGIIQPLVLRKINDKYEIIAGERRYKAACLAGLKTVPAIINNTDDNTSAEIALLENLQRKNLTVIEEAQSFKKLMDKGFTQEDIANKLGISQSSIANKIRLLNLPKEVRDALLYNQISERHARSLLSLNNADLQKSLLNKIINEKLTVKQTEDEISNLLMKKLQGQDNNYVSEDIQRFLRPEPIKEEVNKPKEISEILEFNIPSEKNAISEIKDNNEVNNNENEFKEIVSTNETINPYVSDNNYENNINENTNTYANNNYSYENIIDRLPINYETDNNLEKNNKNIKEELNYNELDSQQIINNIKEFTNKINNDNKNVRITKIK